MPSIFDLIKKCENKMSELNELKTEIIEEKRMRQLDEANIWLSTDFKSMGATNDKMRNAVVQQKMNQFPNTYAQKKIHLEKLEDDIKLICKTIDVMKTFKVEDVDLDL